MFALKKIFGSETLQVIPVSDGLVVSYRMGDEDGKTRVGFRHINFSDGRIQNVQRSYYLVARYGNLYKYIDGTAKNYFTCLSADLSDGGALCVESDGTALKMDENGEIIWRGELLHKGVAPYDIAPAGRSFWASFPKNSSLVRYSLKTMREELKLGGVNSAICSPEGIWTEGKEIFVCNKEPHKIYKVNLSNYDVVEYASFEEPVHRFVQSGGYEFVLLDSGLYMLELIDL